MGKWLLLLAAALCAACCPLCHGAGAFGGDESGAAVAAAGD